MPSLGGGGGGGGATVGVDVGVGVGVAEGVALGVAVALGDAEAEGVGVGVTTGPGVALDRVSKTMRTTMSAIRIAAPMALSTMMSLRLVRVSLMSSVVSSPAGVLSRSVGGVATLR